MALTEVILPGGPALKTALSNKQQPSQSDTRLLLFSEMLPWESTSSQIRSNHSHRFSWVRVTRLSFHSNIFCFNMVAICGHQNFSISPLLTNTWFDYFKQEPCDDPSRKLKPFWVLQELEYGCYPANGSCPLMSGLGYSMLSHKQDIHTMPPL